VNFRVGPRASALLALASGGLAGIAQPPFGILPGLLGYALLAHLVDIAPAPRPLRAAFWRGWLAGFAYFFIGCWWVAEAFMVDARGQGWMAPFAACLLPAGLGLFWGAGTALYKALTPGRPWRWLVLAGTLTALEWVRGHLLTGFPWNLPGETWPAGGAVSQTASLVGAYGLTWITLAGASAFAAIVAERNRAARFAPPVLAVLALAGMWGFGELRLRHAVAPLGHEPVVRIVQPDVPELDKYSGDNVRSIFLRYVSLTSETARRAPDIVVWSEGAIPLSADNLLSPGAGWAQIIRQSLHPGETLMFGGYRETGQGAGVRAYNSLIAVRAGDEGLQVTGIYDKYKLVPFGEFIPAKQILGPIGFKDLAHLTDGFDFGPRPRPIAPAGVPPVQPLICYESLFPELVRDAVNSGPARPRWIVNVSNDAWFGVTSGPLQHLNQASYRAIENGMPVARATPTGVSAMIDAYGRIPAGDALGLGKTGVIDAELPPALPITTYGRAGDLPLAGLLILSLLASGERLIALARRMPMTIRTPWRKDGPPSAR
jgi:apolipoprotein N-acyltransferase